MTPYFWLGVAALLVGVVALTGLGPKGGKPVARTHLMRTARGMLLVGIVVFGILGLIGAINR